MFNIAVDGGATKTIAAIYDEDEILAIGASGPSNYRNIGINKTVTHIKQAINYALRKSGISENDVNRYVFAIAGVKDSNKSTEIIDGITRNISGNKEKLLLNDGEAGYFSRFLNNDGIVIAPGTGMIAYGKKSNNFQRTSGWGWFIGDEGGGFYIGRKALQESAKLEDGRSEYNSDLNNKIKTFYNIETGRDIVNIIYKNKMDIRTIASLSTIVSQLANNGDELSKHIMEEAATEASLCAVSLYKRLNYTNVTVSGYGGVYRSGDLYWKTLTKNIKDKLDNISFKYPLYGYHAVIGSIIMSKYLRGTEVDENDVERLKSQVDRLISQLPATMKRKYLYIY